MVQTNIKSKIFGLGLSRTGTTSLGAALNKLGIKTIHYPHDETTQRELLSGTGKLSLLNRYQGIVDISVVPFYRQLDRAYPNSKFILTIRKKESWLKSVSKSLAKTAEVWSSLSNQYRQFFQFINERVYGAYQFDQDRFSKAYDNHLQDVFEYFHARPNDLLVMDITNGDGWDKLCPFLQLPVPEVPFPRQNDAQSHLNSFDNLVNLKENLQSVIPAKSQFILIDHGTLDDLQFDHRHPMTLVEWGLPADDHAAITALEEHRKQKTDFIAFLWPCFWWFDYYSQLRDYLNSEFSCILKNDYLVVFDLRS